MTRVAGWESRLVSIVRDRLTRKFEWGANDCATFAADAVLAVTGDDPMASVRGTYRTEAEAGEILKRKRQLRRAATEALGPALSEKKFAQRGDVVLTREHALGVVVGTKAMVPGPHGLVAVDMNEWVCAWRI